MNVLKWWQMINLKKYFQRIGYKETPDISVKTLGDIHVAHAFSIPFENLSIHDLSNNPDQLIKLDKQSLIDKIITKIRGGYCHETNELLAIVLLQLGFKVNRLAARVLKDNIYGHKLLLVTIDKEKYIADVGFGGNGLIAPIPLKTNVIFKQFSEQFKLTKQKTSYVLHTKIKDQWSALYSFNLSSFRAHDYEIFNYYMSHSQNSIFVTNRICAVPTPTGRIILNNLELKIRHNGQNESKIIPENEYLETLKKYFGIKLPQNTKFKKLQPIILN